MKALSGPGCLPRVSASSPFCSLAVKPGRFLPPHSPPCRLPAAQSDRPVHRDHTLHSREPKLGVPPYTEGLEYFGVVLESRHTPQLLEGKFNEEQEKAEEEVRGGRKRRRSGSRGRSGARSGGDQEQRPGYSGAAARVTVQDRAVTCEQERKETLAATSQSRGARSTAHPHEDSRPRVTSLHPVSVKHLVCVPEEVPQVTNRSD